MRRTLNEIRRVQRQRRSPRDERGQALVEFALVLPILMIILLGTLQFGIAFFQWQQLSAAVSEGARIGIVSASEANPAATVRTAAEQAAPGLADGITINVDGAFTPGQDITVTGTFPVSINVLGMVVYEGDLQSTRTMRVV